MIECINITQDYPPFLVMQAVRNGLLTENTITSNSASTWSMTMYNIMM